MFDAPTIKFLQLPIMQEAYRFTRTICDATTYYGRSQSRNAIILCARLLHLYSLEFETSTTRNSKALSILEMPNLYALPCVAIVFKMLHDPEVGLGETLINAIKAVRITKGDKEEQALENKKHAIICQELQESYDALCKCYFADDESIDAAEKDVVALIEKYHADTGYPVAKRYCGNPKDFALPIAENVQFLCAEKRHIGGWSRDVCLKRASWQTDDEALKSIISHTTTAAKTLGYVQTHKKMMKDCSPEKNSPIKKRKPHATGKIKKM